jgi:hypothetical protein
LTYGLLAEFESPDALVAATRAAYNAGFRKLDAYSPFPIEELSEAMHDHKNPIPLIVLIAGLTGACVGFGMQTYANLIHYPLNIGGRPFYTWPAFIPVTFECTVAFAAFTGVLSMLALNGLPTPYHPLFNCPSFSQATRDKFFLCIEAVDPKFDPKETRTFLEGLKPVEVQDVEN